MTFKQLHQLIAQTLIKPGKHVYLIRHGQSMANKAGSIVGWTDTRLSLHGRQQSNKLYGALYTHIQKFTSFHTSDLLRCKDTLNISLGYPTSIKIKQTQALRQLNFGDHEGLHFDSLTQQQKKIYNINYQAPNGENWLQVRQRAIKYISTFDKGHHLISTHGGLMCTLTYQLGIKDVVPNCSVIGIQINNEQISKINFVWNFPKIQQV